MNAGLGNCVGAGLVIGGGSPYPSQCSSIIAESLASRSHYSSPTILGRVSESQEQYRGLEEGNNLFAGIDGPLSQEVTGNTQSSGI